MHNFVDRSFVDNSIRNDSTRQSATNAIQTMHSNWFKWCNKHLMTIVLANWVEFGCLVCGIQTKSWSMMVTTNARRLTWTNRGWNERIAYQSHQKHGKQTQQLMEQRRVMSNAIVKLSIHWKMEQMSTDTRVKAALSRWNGRSRHGWWESLQIVTVPA